MEKVGIIAMTDLDDPLYRISLGYIKKERYTGSSSGTRFMLEKEESGEGEEKVKKIHVCLWPEPYAYEKTADELKQHEYFLFNEDGLKEAWEYVKSVTGAATQSL